MSDYIICPNCGKKISLKQCTTITKLFFSYKICINCGCNFTSFNCKDNIGYHIVIYFTILSILGGGNIIINILSEKMSYILFVIMFLLAIFGIVVNLNRQRKFIKDLNNSTNAFMPIIENKIQDKIVKYVFENELSVSEENLKFVTIRSNNIKVLLPYPNLYMLLRTKVNIDKLKMYYTYKILINKSELFVVLSDFKIYEENIILCFKSFGKCTSIESENEYNLLTFCDEMIGNVKLTE